MPCRSVNGSEVPASPHWRLIVDGTPLGIRHALDTVFRCLPLTFFRATFVQHEKWSYLVNGAKVQFQADNHNAPVPTVNRDERHVIHGHGLGILLISCCQYSMAYKDNVSDLVHEGSWLVV